jgi:hypothetical protein
MDAAYSTGEQMVTELMATDESARLQSAVVERLVRKVPSGTKCIFLNCEMQDSPGGMAMSDDLFAVVKPLFGRPKRVTIDLDADAFKLLTALGRLELAAASQQHVTIDLIVDAHGSCKVFRDDGPLRRLGGGQRSFKAKHKSYVEIEPWLAEVD